MKRLAVMGCALTLTACAAAPSITSVSDPSTGYKAIDAKSAMDTAGGPRQDVLVVTDGTGKVIGAWQSSGPGTLQSAMQGAASAAMTGASIMGGARLLRPSETIVTQEDKR